METVAPFIEVIDEIKEAGGDAFKLCFQCGLCDTVCPWNRVRTIQYSQDNPGSYLWSVTEIEGEDIWRCTTCGRCPERCPKGRKTDRCRSFPAQGCLKLRGFSRIRPFCSYSKSQFDIRRQPFAGRPVKIGLNGQKNCR